MTATNTAADVQLDPAAVPPSTQLGQPTMGTLTFSSKTSSFDAVAAWLQSLSRQDGYLEPTMQTAAKDEGAETAGTVFSVSSTTSLSLEAASMRYEQVLESE